MAKIKKPSPPRDVRASTRQNALALLASGHGVILNEQGEAVARIVQRTRKRERSRQTKRTEFTISVKPKGKFAGGIVDSGVRWLLARRHTAKEDIDFTPDRPEDYGNPDYQATPLQSVEQPFQEGASGEFKLSRLLDSFQVHFSKRAPGLHLISLDLVYATSELHPDRFKILNWYMTPVNGQRYSNASDDVPISDFGAFESLLYDFNKSSLETKVDVKSVIAQRPVPGMFKSIYVTRVAPPGASASADVIGFLSVYSTKGSPPSWMRSIMDETANLAYSSLRMFGSVFLNDPYFSSDFSSDISSSSNLRSIVERVPSFRRMAEPPAEALSDSSHLPEGEEGMSESEQIEPTLITDEEWATNHSAKLAKAIAELTDEEFSKLRAEATREDDSKYPLPKQ